MVFKEYKNVLLEEYTNINYHKMHLLNSTKHEMYVKELNKKTISPFDDKRWISNNKITTFPHGYEELNFC